MGCGKMKRIIKLVTARYNVLPIDSNSASEEFVWEAGLKTVMLSFVHYTFGSVVHGRMKDNQEDLIQAMLNAIGQAWQKETPVIWRRKPELSEWEDFDIAGWHSKITLRIGAPMPPAIGYVDEGNRFPDLIRGVK